MGCLVSSFILDLIGLMIWLLIKWGTPWWGYVLLVVIPCLLLALIGAKSSDDSEEKDSKGTE